MAHVHGFNFGLEENFPRIWLESDSIVAVQLVIGDCGRNHPYASLVLAIRELHSHNWTCRISHVPHKGNRVVDCFANFGHYLEVGLHCWRGIHLLAIGDFCFMILLGWLVPG